MPVHVGSAVLVTGDTYEKKAKLIAISGGTWCKQLNVEPSQGTLQYCIVPCNERCRQTCNKALVSMPVNVDL